MAKTGDEAHAADPTDGAELFRQASDGMRRPSSS